MNSLSLGIINNIEKDLFTANDDTESSRSTEVDASIKATLAPS